MSGTRNGHLGQADEDKFSTSADEKPEETEIFKSRPTLPRLYPSTGKTYEASVLPEWSTCIFSPLPSGMQLVFSVPKMQTGEV